MYAMNLDFKFDFTNIKNGKKNTQENHRSPYIFYSGVSRYVQNMCDAYDIISTQENVCLVAGPGDSG